MTLDKGPGLEIQGDGKIVIPTGQVPRGIYLAILVPADSSTFIVRRDNVGGDYRELWDSEGSERTDLDGRPFDFYPAEYPIAVIIDRKGLPIRTVWKKESPNRVDCWTLRPDGSLELFQIGVVITFENDSGAFRLVGETAWRGKLFTRDGDLVARPDHAIWGPMIEVRKRIFSHRRFTELLHKVSLETWTGREEELDPTVPPPPKIGFARVLWHNSFMGETGMALVRTVSGEAWVHGSDILDEPDVDGLRRFRRGDLVSYKGVPISWSVGKPPILRGVVLVQATP